MAIARQKLVVLYMALQSRNDAIQGESLRPLVMWETKNELLITKLIGN